MTRCILTAGCAVITPALLCIVAAPGANAQDIPPEIKVLEKRIGAWDATTTGKRAVWTPDGVENAGAEKIELALKGRFIRGNVTNVDKSEATWLATYDVNAKAFRVWYFDSWGTTTTSAGQWDEKTKTLTWTDTNAEGVVSVSHWRFIDVNSFEWDLLAKDKDGKVYLDIKGKLTRKK